MKVKQETAEELVDVGFRYLLVSLFLAVLAFFIVLNSISKNSKDKSNEFLEQVKKEFIGKDFLNDFKMLTHKQSRSGAADKPINAKNTINDFLINNSLLISSEITDYGKIFEIKISKGSIFNIQSDYPKTSATKFLREFSKILSKQIRMNNFNVILVTSYNPSEEGNFNLNASRSYSITEKMKFNLQKNVNFDSYLIPYKESDSRLKYIKIIIYLDEI